METRYRLDTHVALAASAGSGKTYALTLRFLKLLMHGTPPDQVLCTTFTNKATREMAERLMARLAMLIDDRPEDREEIDAVLARLLDKAEVDERDRVDGRERAKGIRTRLLRRYSRLHVATMDSFFNTVLRLFPFEAGTTPDFVMINEAREQEIFRTALDALVADIEGNPEERDLLRRLVFTLSRTQNAPHAVLMRYFDLLAPRRVGLQKLSREPGRAGLRARGAELDALGSESVRRAHEFGEMIDRLEIPLSSSGRKTVEKICALAFPDEIADMTPFRKNNYRDYSYFRKCPDDPALHASFQAVRVSFGRYLEAKSSFATDTLRHFFQRFTTRADAQKRRIRALSFTDVERLCFNLLVGNDRSGVFQGDGADYFYYRLDARLKHLLMDEFQDTNTVQWGIFRPVVMEITADREGSFFYVGDPKQAIYRFRGGEAGLFTGVREELKTTRGLEEDTLPRNYRSAASLVGFVNTVFSHVARSRGYLFEEQAPIRETSGRVSIYTVPPATPDGAEEPPWQAAAAETVLRLHAEGIPYADIAVLCDDNNSCTAVAGSLENRGAPASTEKKDSLFLSPSVRTLTRLFGYILNERDEASLVDFLSQVAWLLPPGTLGKIREAERGRKRALLGKIAPGVGDALDDLRNRADLSTVKELAVAAMKAFRLGRRFPDAGNLMKFVASADGISDAPRPGLQGFLDDIERYGDAVPLAADARPDAVQVLTVHKSKGLEFRAVVLPTMTRPIRFDKKKSDFMFPQRGDFTLDGVHLTPTTKELDFSDTLRNLFEQEQRKTLEDSLNLLYVALTRARDNLVLVAPRKPEPAKPPSSPPAPTWFSIVADAVGLDLHGEPGGTVPIYERGDDATRERHSTEPRVPERLQGTEGAAEELPDPPPLGTGGGPARPEDELDDTRVLPLTPERLMARRYGEAFHLAAEGLPPGMDPARAAAYALGRHGALLDDVHRSRLHRDLDLLVGDPAILRIFSAGTVLTELPLREKGARLRKADAVIVGGEKITVLDYKTQERKELLADYRAQVAGYMQLLQTVYPEKIVEGYLVFVDESIRLEPVNR